MTDDPFTVDDLLHALEAAYEHNALPTAIELGPRLMTRMRRATDPAGRPLLEPGSDIGGWRLFSIPVTTNRDLLANQYRFTD